MPWYFAVAEARHEIQNPSSREKILLLGERLLLGPESHVLDLASGKSVPAILLATAYGCRVTCVERAVEFHEEARERVAAAGLGDRIELLHGDAAAFPLEPGRWDAVLCLGASFVWGGLRPTLAALVPAVRPRGFVAVGEPYRRGDADYEFGTLEENVAELAAAGVEPVTVVAASVDDWDRYETLHWLAVDEWLHANPDDPEADELRAQHVRAREEYLRRGRDGLGWAILVGRR